MKTQPLTVTFTGKNARRILEVAKVMETTPEKAAAYWLDLSFKCADERLMEAQEAYRQEKVREKLAERIEPCVIAKLFGPADFEAKLKEESKPAKLEPVNIVIDDQEELRALHELAKLWRDKPVPMIRRHLRCWARDELRAARIERDPEKWLPLTR